MKRYLIISWHSSAWQVHVSLGRFLIKLFGTNLFVDHLQLSNAQDVIDPVDTTMTDDFAPDAGNKARANAHQPHIPIDTKTVPGS